jgi:hypothetical protein
MTQEIKLSPNSRVTWVQTVGASAEQPELWLVYAIYFSLVKFSSLIHLLIFGVRVLHPVTEANKVVPFIPLDHLLFPKP